MYNLFALCHIIRKSWLTIPLIIAYNIILYVSFLIVYLFKYYLCYDIGSIYMSK